MRVLAAGFLVLIAAFCAYGSLASLEPGTGIGWLIGYASVGGLALILALVLVWPRKR